MRIIVIIIIVMLITSCKSYKRIERLSKEMGICPTSDSISYVETVKYDTIETDVSRMRMELSLMVDSERNIAVHSIDSLSSENMDLKMKLNDNKLIIYGNVKSRIIRVPRLMTSINRTKIITQYKNIITGWQWAQIWAGRGLLSLLLIVIIIQIIKKFMK